MGATAPESVEGQTLLWRRGRRCADVVDASAVMKSCLGFDDEARAVYQGVVV